MKTGVRIALVACGIALVAVMGTLVAMRTEPWLSASDAFKKGTVLVKRGAYGKAFHYVKMAADKAPAEPRYAWAAAQAAVAIGNPNAAYLYAQRAWKTGRKERDVLGALVRFSFFSDKKQRLNYALSLVNEMADSVDKQDLRAGVYADFGEPAQARALWLSSQEKSPASATSTKIARTYLQEGNDSLALLFLQSCEKQHTLNNEGFGILAKLFAKKSDLMEAERCYREAAAANGASDQLQLDHTLFLAGTGNFQDAASSLDSMIAKYPEDHRLETMRIELLLAKNDPDAALRECETSGAPIAAVAPLKARALARLGRLSEAEASYDSALVHNAGERVRIEFGNFLLFSAHKADKARKIFGAVHASHPSEPVSNLGLATLAIEARYPADARKYAEEVLAGRTGNPLAYQLLAQANLLEGNPRAALDNCNRALKLEPSLEKALFVKVEACNEIGLLDSAAAILAGLESRPQSGGEKGNFIGRALISIKIRQKKFGEALALVDKLERRAPSPGNRRMRIEIYAADHDLQKARTVLESLQPSLTKAEYLSYQSRLLEMSGDTAQAAALLESDLSTKSLLMRWAGLRLESGHAQGVLEKLPLDSITTGDWTALGSTAVRAGQYGAAAVCYKHALSRDGENPSLLNNYAYASLQTPDFNHEEVLDAVRKAFAGLSGRQEVLQTYAEALNKCGKPAECIRLLRDKTSQIRNSTSLLCQLGVSYENTGDLRGALSSFRLAIERHEPSAGWPSGFGRQELQARVERLSAALTK
jgi:predicted Zn-dependent protease